MSKLIALRVKPETAQALYDLATDQHRLPGQQVDVIVEDYLARHTLPAVVGTPVADDSTTVRTAQGA